MPEIDDSLKFFQVLDTRDPSALPHASQTGPLRKLTPKFTLVST